MASVAVHFVVLGRPQPQGSTRSFWKQGMKRAITTADNPKLKSWRHDVRSAAAEALATVPFPKGAPVALEAHFYLLRPASKPKRVVRPAVIPDVDKLLRALCDALAGVAYENDGQVVDVTVRKFYGFPERTEIWLGPANETSAGAAVVQEGPAPSLFAEVNRITDEGLLQIGAVPALPTGPHLVAMWRSKFKSGIGRMLDVLVERYPDAISREELGSAAGFAASGGTFSECLSALRRAGLIEEPSGKVRAADSLCGT